MKNKKVVIARNKEHLNNLIHNEIDSNGNSCDLNHIDVSNITDMSYLFNTYHFYGDVSKWDTSKVKNMDSMFANSIFKGDISNWDTSRVTSMCKMFKFSQFNGDLSHWPLSNILKITNMKSMFEGCSAIKPWWYIEDNNKRNKYIQIYIAKEDLMYKLNDKLTPSIKVKTLKI